MDLYVDQRLRQSGLRAAILGAAMGLTQCLPHAIAVGPNKKSRSKLRPLVLVIS
jgi:hypothetical protein